MTTVLPSLADSDSCFSPDPERRPIAQRYFLKNPEDAMTKPLQHFYYPSDYPSPITSSVASSSPPSPNLTPTAIQHFPPTPTGSISPNGPDSQDGDLLLPSYDSAYFQVELSLPTEISVDSSVNLQLSAPHVPPADDSSAEEEPSRHVDYLSHEWKEEDIWASWRYVVARREVYENSARLENASWRTWAKLKHDLGTVSPDALNWLKDCDVTWLYGPLKTPRTCATASNVSPPPSCSESPSICPDRKSILKKRTASETILQRSLSQHTLLQHAGAILKAKEAEHSRSRPGLGDHLLSFEQMVNQSYAQGVETPRGLFTANILPSGATSPSEKRHIHFNNEVVQCIALEGKEEEEEEEWLEFGGESSWDDSIMVKQAVPSGRSTPRGSFSGENKTIAPLPSTTLKYRRETPEPQPSSITNRWSWASYIPGSRLFSSSSFVESLRHSGWSSGATTLAGDRIASDFDWNATQDAGDSSRSWFVNSAEDDEADQNFYLASLGFLPHEGKPTNTDILFDRMIDTVNTAKDIAHVIWNVGWRRESDTPTSAPGPEPMTGL